MTPQEAPQRKWQDWLDGRQWQDLLEWKALSNTFLAMFFNSAGLAGPDSGVERVKFTLRALLWGLLLEMSIVAVARAVGWSWNWKAMGIGVLLPAGQVIWIPRSFGRASAAFSTHWVLSCVALGTAFALPEHPRLDLAIVSIAAVAAIDSFIEHIYLLRPVWPICVVTNVLLFQFAVGIGRGPLGAETIAKALMLSLGSPGVSVMAGGILEMAVYARLFRRRSAWLDWSISMVILVVASYLGGLAFARAFLYPSGFSIWTSVLVIFLSYTRLPLWPLEAVWGEWNRRRRKSEPGQVNLDNAYFDMHMVWELPGEAKSIIESRAAGAAASRVLFSHHLPTCVGALKELSRGDPLFVQAEIWKVPVAEGYRDRVLAYVADGVKEGREQVWQAQSLVLEWSVRLQQRTGQTERISAPPRGPLPVSSQPSTKPESGLPEAEAIRSASDALMRASTHLELALDYNRDLKHVRDLAAIYSTIARALRAENLRDIYTWRTGPLAAVPTVAASVNEALTELDKVPANMEVLEKTTSLVRRGSVLLQAGDELEQVAQALRHPAHSDVDPFGALNHFLRFVVIRWRAIIASAGAESARQAPARVKNPYVIADPVSGHLFVGRDDILSQIEDLWTAEGTLPSIVLYGHRRMGKSSILQNIPARFSRDLKAIYFNMQQHGVVRDTAELLYSLAVTIHGSLSPAQQRAVKRPQPFTQGNPTTGFNLFMESLRPVRDHNRIVLLIDEFEMIERGIQEGRFDPQLMDYFRGLVQNIKLRLAICFAGLHTLEEMTHSYWHPFFAGLKKVRVSFLSPEATRKLITQPVPEFDFNYDPGVTERIIELTNGQPYLVQLVGHTLVRRFNRSEARTKKELERRFTMQDLDQVISDPEFYADGDAYFDGIKEQAADNPPFQHAVLLQLIGGPATIEEMAARCGLPAEDIREAVEALLRHAVVLEKGEKYGYAVELMRLWVEQQALNEGGFKK